MKLTNFVTRPIAAAAAIAVLGLTLGSAQAATFPFSEDFDSGSAPDFTFVPAADVWSVGSGVLTGNTTGADTLSTAAVQITNAPAGANLVVSTTLRATTFDGNSDAGIAAFGDDATFDFIAGVGHYLADFKPSGDFRILRIETLANITTIADSIADGVAPFSFDTSDTYTLTLEATYSGSDLDLTFTIDDPTGGAVSISGTDTVPLTGQYFGPRQRTSGPGIETLVAEYDNFSVAIPEPSSMALVALSLVGMVSLRKRNHC